MNDFYPLGNGQTVLVRGHREEDDEPLRAFAEDALGGHLPDFAEPILTHRTYFRCSTYASLIAIFEGHVVGHLYFLDDVGLVVASEFQWRGVEDALVRSFVGWCAGNLDVGIITLKLRRDDLANVALWLKHGFQETSVYETGKGYYKDLALPARDDGWIRLVRIRKQK